MLQATQLSLRHCRLRADCESVHLGAAIAPSRRFARAWASLVSCIEGDCARVAWMPAHCRASAVGVRVLSNGKTLTDIPADK